ncbi:gliding motility-associated-like protein [Pedobacter cryoconitis]|uniref:Gliding motility-associated-like protein n=1 Tax=Pedobacter cryoconitis TaxID=188932 RepID=A0A7W8ZMK3_9SPHI|nr:gliding motility-associated C-terminal domain-containing protein [Pedobacter cryoconitis]MBB5636628.1 gliding motility-associated-like protein [Pedobacter cryoconitis]
MKKIIVSIAAGLLLFGSQSLKAQLSVGSDGLFIQNGTVFSTDGLTLVPAKDWGLNNLKVMMSPAVVIWPRFNSIQRMYRFSKPVTFEGEVALSFQDIELNGNEAKDLVLAHSKVTSTNYKDYTLVQESVSSEKEHYVGQLFTKPIVFADLNAVSMISSSTVMYKDIEANNMITPNGDGVNDVWIVKNILQYPNNELKIFDREGRVVFSKIGYDNTWDGQFNGNPLPEDTYYYILYFDSGKAKKTGFITIVKEQ